ncbi:MAG: hypothetical protein NVSMB9_33940 [Isosphaeraceae bacterium]
MKTLDSERLALFQARFARPGTRFPPGPRRPETCVWFGINFFPTFNARSILAMDKLTDELMTRVGLDRGAADKVVQFLKDNVHRLPELLQSDAAKGVMDKLPGGLGGMLGGKG